MKYEKGWHLVMAATGGGLRPVVRWATGNDDTLYYAPWDDYRATEDETYIKFLGTLEEYGITEGYHIFEQKFEGEKRYMVMYVDSNRMVRSYPSCEFETDLSDYMMYSEYIGPFTVPTKGDA